jgi:predicted transcriptional regulator
MTRPYRHTLKDTVGERLTLSDVARKSVTVRLSDAGMDRVEQLAADETEGNVSQMVRKLLAEAIHRRDLRADDARPGPAR